MAIARGRRGARRLAVQALYQSQLAEHDLASLLEQFRADPGYASADGDYFEALLGDACRERDQLELDIAEFGHIPPAQLDPVEHAVLWVALAELRFQEVPGPVILNEAIELAKIFGSTGGHRYVNGLLDKACARLRAKN